MATIKIKVPETEGNKLRDRWKYFFDVERMHQDSITMDVDDAFKEPCFHFIEKEALQEGVNKGKNILKRLSLYSKNKMQIVYLDTPAFIMENGKTVERIN